MAYLKSLIHFVVVATVFTCVSSAIIPDDVSIIDLDFSEAYEICKTSVADTYGAVRYGGEPAKAIQYGECLEVKKGAERTPIDYMFFCKPANCYIFSDDKCSDDALNLVVPIPLSSIGIPNAVDVGQFLGQSVYCKPSQL